MDERPDDLVVARLIPGRSVVVGETRHDAGSDDAAGGIRTSALPTSSARYWMGMSPKNVQILRRCAELLNVGDWDALFELYHPDVEVEFRDVRPPPNIPEVLHGREGLRRVVAHWTAPYDEFGAEVYQYIDADPWVICATRWHGKSTGSDLPAEVRFADAYELKGGKIRRAIIGYSDVAIALDELGLRGG